MEDEWGEGEMGERWYVWWSDLSGSGKESACKKSFLQHHCAGVSVIDRNLREQKDTSWESVISK